MNKKLGIISITSLFLITPAIMVSCSNNSNNNDVVSNKNFYYNPNNNSSKIISKEQWDKMFFAQDVAFDGNNKSITYKNSNEDKKIIQRVHDQERFAFIVDGDWILMCKTMLYSEDGSEEKLRFYPSLFVFYLYSENSVKYFEYYPYDQPSSISKDECQYIIDNYKSIFKNFDNMEDRLLDENILEGFTAMLRDFSWSNMDVAKMLEEENNQNPYDIQSAWYANRDDKIPVIPKNKKH
ncbi:hypothetical protein ACJA28_01015 [Mesomycoplasma moatsii]|uniref:hypothetical protein n=1 Tax=Mesomycoplasma moatsii TaxID=171287 RepID=UPI0003B4E37E